MPDPPGTFGDYASFLEIAFAFNAFYGIWSYVATSAARARQPRARMAVIVHAFPTAEQARTKAFRSLVDQTDKTVKWGRYFGFAVAGTIAACLSLVHPKEPMWSPLIVLCWAPAALRVGVEIYFRGRSRWIEWSITNRYTGALEELLAKDAGIPNNDAPETE